MSRCRCVRGEGDLAPARRDLQQDDARSSVAAQRAGREANASIERAAPVHRGGAGRASRAGVIGIDPRRHVTLVNRVGRGPAGDLAEATSLGKPAAEAVAGGRPPSSARRLAGTPRLVQRAGDADLPRRRGAHLQRAGDDGERRERQSTAIVVTLDDITDLVTAQRTLGLGRRRPPHRARDQEPADADPAVGRAHPRRYRQGDHRGRPRGLRPAAPTPSSARSRTSAAWSTSSRPSRECRSRRSSRSRTSPTRCARVVLDLRVAYPDLEIGFSAPEDAA